MTMLFERLLFESHQAGLTPEMVKAVITSRKQRKRAGEYGVRGTWFYSIFGEENCCWCIEEYHHLQAQGRIRIADPARTSVLRATHRVETTGTDKPAQSATDVIEKLKTGYSEMRKEAGL